jgi:phosphopantothenoylcysteine decarboxylase/phosphopantothenate--cysteine ligase
MWGHRATQRNVERLRGDGVAVLDPDEGPMACGEYGPGRLPEPAAIWQAARERLASVPPGAESSGPLAGRHVLVTAGPTHEPIDPVRYIANRSSGKQGYAIAGALAELGARVTLVSGPVGLATPPGVRRIDVESAREMAAAVEAALPADAAIMVAAVADWRAEAASGQKIKKDRSGASPVLTLTENPDILAGLAASARRPRLLVGFAAETEDVVDHAIAKRARKKADWIVANDVSGDVMGGDSNRIHIVTAGGVESWETLAKADVARRLAARIADALA